MNDTISKGFSEFKYDNNLGLNMATTRPHSKKVKVPKWVLGFAPNNNNDDNMGSFPAN